MERKGLNRSLNNREFSIKANKNMKSGKIKSEVRGMKIKSKVDIWLALIRMGKKKLAW